VSKKVLIGFLYTISLYIAHVFWNCELVLWVGSCLTWHCALCPFHREVSGGPRHACHSYHCKHQWSL